MAKDNEIVQAVKQICEEKNISFESVIETIEAALAVAYRKDFGEKNENIKVEFDIESAKAKVFDVKTVVTDEKFELTEKLKEEKLAEEEESSSTDVTADKSAVSEDKKPKKEKKEIKKDPARPASQSEAGETSSGEDDFERFNPKTEITLSEAKKLKKGSKLEDEIKTELIPPAAYGRMAAQTAKQVIVQRLREAEREMVYKEFKDKEGDVINGTIQRIEGRMVLIDLGPTTALLPPGEQVPRERYASGQRFKFYVVAVNETPKGPEIILSRAHVDMVRKLFHLEVPEVGNGSVEIKSIAREAGSRTKIAVFTNQKNIDPVGSCVGQRGSRVQTIISEIGGEKIDIVEWDEDPDKFITNALSPAKVLGVQIKEAEKIAIVEVKEDQLSLAIGKSGQNVRLSAKLTGWKIDIVSETGEKVSPNQEKKDREKSSSTMVSAGKSEDKKEDKDEKEDEKDPVRPASRSEAGETSLPTGQVGSEEEVDAEEKVEEKKEEAEEEAEQEEDKSEEVEEIKK